MKLTRSILQSVTAIGLIAVACWNVTDYTATTFSVPGTTDVAGWEKLFEPIQEYLTTVGYGINDLGYVSSTQLQEGITTEEESIHRAYLYYVAIPMNIVQNKLDAPYIVGDFLRARPDKLPPGLVQVFDPGNGLVLLQSTRDK
jgi:hypothetical protein